LVVPQRGLQQADQRRDHGGSGGHALPTEGLGQRALLGTELPDEGLRTYGGLLIIMVVAWGHRVVLQFSRVMSYILSLGRVQDALP
jgi:hypothetical protein